MKKNFKFFSVIWAVSLVIFNAITFLIPNQIFGVTRYDKAVFWISYALVTASFIAQIVTAYIFIKDDSTDKAFLNIPLLKTGYIAVITSLIVGLIFMIIPVIPTIIGAIICLLVAGYFVIACVKAGTVANVVSEIDEKIKTKAAFIRLATVDAESIMARATTNEVKVEAKKVYEALRYSDPMSNDLLNGVEQEIDTLLKEFKKAVTNNDNDIAIKIASELLLLIKERNSKCKALK